MAIHREVVNSLMEVAHILKLVVILVEELLLVLHRIPKLVEVRLLLEVVDRNLQQHFAVVPITVNVATIRCLMDSQDNQVLNLHMPSLLFMVFLRFQLGIHHHFMDRK